MKFVSTIALVLGAFATSVGFVSCSSGDTTDMAIEDLSEGDTGSLRLALQAGDRVITTVVAVIEGKNFQTQTHEIDVQGNNGVISIFFGDLPVGKKYRITLTAADCSGSANFNVTANQVSLVNVPLSCGGSNSDDTGGVQVTGTISSTGGGGQDCEHVLKIVAAPSIQNGDGPVSRVELFLNDDVEPTTINWTSSSTNGAAGTIGDLSGTTDKKISFDCTANGTVFVAANVTAPRHHSACTEQARVSIECNNQAPCTGPVSSCGNGVIENVNFCGTDEVCDTNGAGADTLPPNTPANSTCNPTCTAIIPGGGGPACGNGFIEAPEICDTNGLGADVLPPNTPANSTCNATCTAVLPPPGFCGDGIIGTGEVCDTNGLGADVLPPTAPSGSTCNANCTAVVPPAFCGNGTIDLGETCDTNGAGADVLPANTPVGSSCNASCTAILPPPPVTCGNGTIDSGEVCDTNGAGADVLPPTAPSGSTCNASCTAVVPPPCGNGTIDSGEACDTNGAGADVLPPTAPSGSTCNATCTAVVPPICGNGVIDSGEACDTNGAGADVLPPNSPTGSTCNATCTAVVTTPGGACLTCAKANCTAQFNNAAGTTSDAANTADVTQLLDCVIGPNWEDGGPIPSTSCFFADPMQPQGSLVPCYCGPTPQGTCLASGPANHTQACGVQVETASHCSPLSASCVTSSGSNPDVPLGDALQLLNCERAACHDACGFPIIDDE